MEEAEGRMYEKARQEEADKWNSSQRVNGFKKTPSLLQSGWEDSFLFLSRLPGQPSHLPPESVPPKVSMSTN